MEHKAKSGQNENYAEQPSQTTVVQYSLSLCADIPTVKNKFDQIPLEIQICPFYSDLNFCTCAEHLL